MAERPQGMRKAAASAVAAQAMANASARRAGGRSGARPSRDREQQIRELAYGFFVERGCVDGHELDDWLRAEAQLRQQEEPPPRLSAVKS